MQLCFRNRKGLGRDSDLFLHSITKRFHMGDDSGLKIQETGALFAMEEKQCRAAARKILPALISCCLQSILERPGKSDATEVQDFPIALRQAPWEQGGS